MINLRYTLPRLLERKIVSSGKIILKVITQINLNHPFTLEFQRRKVMNDNN